MIKERHNNPNKDVSILMRRDLSFENKIRSKRNTILQGKILENVLDFEEKEKSFKTPKNKIEKNFPKVTTEFTINSLFPTEKKDK